MFFKILKRVLICILAVILAALCLVFGLNIYVKLKVKGDILTVEESAKLKDVDCIMVLGAAVKNGDTPSAMLSDRLDRGIEVYNAGSASRMLMSGDRDDQYYDEVSVMTAYAVEHGVAPEDIMEDPKGYSTYDSMYRAKNVYGVDKMIIVTQRYHLYRALYIANELGIEAYGVAAEDIRYNNQLKRDIREILAIDKDFFKVILRPDVLDDGQN